MKIAHLDSHRTWGGGQQQALYLTQFLRSRGHESVVVGPSGGALLGRARAAGAPSAKLNMRHELDLIAAWRLGAWLRREGVDILHIHEPHAHSIGLLAFTVAPG